MKNFRTNRFAKKPITATDTNLKNCLYGGNFDSAKTKYLVIKKLTSTPKKKEIASESVELRTVVKIT
jgi:hypothetical protein